MITEETVEQLLANYKPKSTQELAEWLMMAARDVKDSNGKRIYFRLEGHIAWQIASRMQAAKLEVPK
jgi:hypothetical protein